jgi:hypothetical protein
MPQVSLGFRKKVLLVKGSLSRKESKIRGLLEVDIVVTRFANSLHLIIRSGVFINEEKVHVQQGAA